MEGLALALVPPDDSDFVFVSPINERCPIGGGGGGGGGKGGVFARGKAVSFGGGGAGGARSARQESRFQQLVEQVATRQRARERNMERDIGPSAPVIPSAAQAARQRAAYPEARTGKADDWSIAVEAGVVYGESPSALVSGLDWKSTVGRKLAFSEMLIVSHEHDEETLFRIYVPRGARGSDDGETVILPAATFTVHAADRYVDLIMHR
jgi:hypothetical protein